MESIQVGSLKIKWLEHASFKISGSKIVYVDPWELKDLSADADLILITHEHHDHFSISDIIKISKPETKILSTEMVCNQISDCQPIKPNQTIEIDNLKITGFPAYNKNKFRSPGVPYHPKEDNKLGFILQIDSHNIYIAGDSDFLNQMNQLENIDLALVPIGGTYTMTAKEAASAVNAFEPKLAIPMHWGKIVGSKKDADEFKRLSEVPVEILLSR